MPHAFDDPALLAAMRRYVLACDTLAASIGDSELLASSEAASIAGLALRKRLVELGWSAPAAQRSTT